MIQTNSNAKMRARDNKGKKINESQCKVLPEIDSEIERERGRKQCFLAVNNTMNQPDCFRLICHKHSSVANTLSFYRSTFLNL